MIPKLSWDSVREREKERWIGYNRIFCGVRTFFMNPMLLFGSGQQIEGKTNSRDENEKFKIIFRASPRGNLFSSTA